MHFSLAYFVILVCAFPKNHWLNGKHNKDVVRQIQKEVMTQFAQTGRFPRSPRTPFRRITATPVNETAIRQVEISSFHATLLNFIQDLYFDHELFLTMVDDLGETLQSILSLTKDTLSPNPMFAKQVAFLLLMFEKMKFGALVMRFYSRRDPKESHWIKIMVQINVILLTLYDSFGNLSLQETRVREKLAATWRDIQILGKSFQGLFGASESAKEFFQEQLLQASEACLNLLNKLLSSGEERRNT